MFFEIFNQYQENRSIFDENDANLTQEVLAKRELLKSTLREKNSVCHEKDRIIQILDDDFISANLANVVSLIDHHVRVKDFRNVFFRRV